MLTISQSPNCNVIKLTSSVRTVQNPKTLHLLPTSYYALEAKCSHLTSAMFKSTGATCTVGTGTVCPKYIRS